MSQFMNVVILTGSPQDEMAFREALSEERRVRVVAASDSPEQVYADVVRWKPNAVIVNLGNEMDPDWTLCRQVSAVCPETLIICASYNSSPDLILDSIRAGAREFLRLPITSDELRTVVNRVGEIGGVTTKVNKKRGRVIALFSNKGGCGTSFLSSNLAAAINQQTVLLDLNLQASSQDLFFGVRPKFSIVDVIQNRSRLDDRLLSGFLIEYSPKLSLLAAPIEAEAAEDIRAEHVVEVIEMLRERFEFVVMDLPHTFDAVTIAALDQADEILLIMTLDILAARAAQRALTIFGRLGYSTGKVRMVLNRWNKQSDLELRHVERFLGERIASFISDDFPAVVNSINLGKPLVTASSGSTIVAELNRLAAVCGGLARPEPEVRKKKGFGGFFGSSKKKTGILKTLVQRAPEKINQS
jgi:pilus assembly protein CpaE